MMKIYFAPLQGYTEDAYRRIHNELCGGVEEYCTPFIRWEHGGVRSKDLRDIRHDFNEGVNVTPQIIAADGDEMKHLMDVVLKEGYRTVDVNMGCPFPLQTRHGRGAGVLPHVEKVAELCNVMGEYDDVDFSVKMRLGLDTADDWKSVLPMLNEAPLRHVTVHPRIGVQQYKGTVSIDAFAEFVSQCSKPVIYNGDINSIADIKRVETAFPNLKGIMIGRGLLARPTMAREYSEGQIMEIKSVVRVMRAIHDRLHEHFARVIPAEAAVLGKLRTFWDYAESTIGRKQWKKIKKAGNMRNYLAAINEL